MNSLQFTYSKSFFFRLKVLFCLFFSFCYFYFSIGWNNVFSKIVKNFFIEAFEPQINLHQKLHTYRLSIERWKIFVEFTSITRLRNEILL